MLPALGMRPRPVLAQSSFQEPLPLLPGVVMYPELLGWDATALTAFYHHQTWNKKHVNVNLSSSLHFLSVWNTDLYLDHWLDHAAVLSPPDKRKPAPWDTLDESSGEATGSGTAPARPGWGRSARSYSSCKHTHVIIISLSSSSDVTCDPGDTPRLHWVSCSHTAPSWTAGAEWRPATPGPPTAAAGSCSGSASGCSS